MPLPYPFVEQKFQIKVVYEVVHFSQSTHFKEDDPIGVNITGEIACLRFLYKKFVVGACHKTWITRRRVFEEKNKWF